MDPNEALRIAASNSSQFPVAVRRQARRDLVEWLRAGGFVPIPRSQHEVAVLHDIRAQARRAA